MDSIDKKLNELSILFKALKSIIKLPKLPKTPNIKVHVPNKANIKPIKQSAPIVKNEDESPISEHYHIHDMKTKQRITDKPMHIKELVEKYGANPDLKLRQSGSYLVPHKAKTV